MRTTVRRAVGVLTAAVLTASGLVAGAAPASAGRGTITGSSGSVSVTAGLQVTDSGHQLNVRVDHNGTAADLTSAMVSVTGPSGESVYSRETSFEPSSTGWTASDFDLPQGLELGRYLLSFDATVSVTTETDLVDVRIAGTDVLEFLHRVRPLIRDVQATPQNLPVGARAVVSGIVLRGSGGKPLTGESVQIWFDPEGTAPRISRGAARIDDRGYFQKTLSVPSDGTWRVEVPESDRIIAAAPVETVQETRPTDRPSRSGFATRSVRGYAGGVGIATADVVVGLEPVTVRFDAGIVGFGWARSLSDVWYESRRGEGRYPDGIQRTADLAWTGSRAAHDYQAAYTTARISPLMPAGVYDVGVTGQTVAVCTVPELESRQRCVDDEVTVDDRTITTMTVKRASLTTTSASSTAFTGSKTITLRGSVRKVQLVNGRQVKLRYAPNTAVRLYFDPAGSQGPAYEKTVRTGSDGVYTARVTTTRSGRWIAKYSGSSLHASSQRSVSITVG